MIRCCDHRVRNERGYENSRCLQFFHNLLERGGDEGKANGIWTLKQMGAEAVAWLVKCYLPRIRMTLGSSSAPNTNRRGGPSANLPFKHLDRGGRLKAIFVYLASLRPAQETIKDT